MPKRKISRAQAIDKLYDLDIPDEELAKLVMVDEAISTPMSPILTFDPEKVETVPKGSWLLAFLITLPVGVAKGSTKSALGTGRVCAWYRRETPGSSIPLF